MKQIATSYTFNASAKTITFTGLIPSSLERILHVTNVTQGALYFQPQAGSSYSGSYSSPVLTLSASTAGHSDADKLIIFYDDGAEVYQNGFAIPHFDYKEINYSGSNISTIVFKLGGSGGTTVATLTYSYSGSNLVGIAKS
jgi:hypothetical protein